jgi:hypothetical protein
MKLQKRLSRKYKTKEYYKYVLVIPEEEIIKAKLKEGDDLNIESKEKEMIIRKL